MKRKFLVVFLSAVFLTGVFSACYAAEKVKTDVSEESAKELAVRKDNTFKGDKPGDTHIEMKYKSPSGEFGPNHNGEFFPKFSKEEMQAKKAEFEKRMNLTDEQKKKIEQNRQKGHEKMKPVFEKKKELREELEKIKQDKSLSESEKHKKIAKIRKQNQELHAKAEKYRSENMKEFESILTDEQKAEFAKIKAERKAEFEKKKKEFEEMKKKTGKAPGNEKQK